MGKPCNSRTTLLIKAGSYHSAIYDNVAGIYKPPANMAPLYPLINARGRGLFRLLFTGSGGPRQRARRKLTKLICLARFVNVDS